jgi:hypothetical protein
VYYEGFLLLADVEGEEIGLDETENVSGSCESKERLAYSAKRVCDGGSTILECFDDYDENGK